MNRQIQSIKPKESIYLQEKTPDRKMKRKKYTKFVDVSEDNSEIENKSKKQKKNSTPDSMIDLNNELHVAAYYLANLKRKPDPNFDKKQELACFKAKRDKDVIEAANLLLNFKKPIESDPREIESTLSLLFELRDTLFDGPVLNNTIYISDRVPENRNINDLETHSSFFDHPPSFIKDKIPIKKRILTQKRVEDFQKRMSTTFKPSFNNESI